MPQLGLPLLGPTLSFMALYNEVVPCLGPHYMGQVANLSFLAKGLPGGTEEVHTQLLRVGSTRGWWIDLKKTFGLPQRLHVAICSILLSNKKS